MSLKLKLALIIVRIANRLIGPRFRLCIEKATIRTVNANDTKTVWRRLAEDVSCQLVPLEVREATVVAHDLFIMTQGDIASIYIDGQKQTKIKRLQLTFDWQEHRGLVYADIQRLCYDDHRKDAATDKLFAALQRRE